MKEKGRRPHTAMIACGQVANKGPDEEGWQYVTSTIAWTYLSGVASVSLTCGRGMFIAYTVAEQHSAFSVFPMPQRNLVFCLASLANGWNLGQP